MTLHQNLQGLPRVNWLTMDQSWNRQESMIRQFERLGIENHQRHRGIEGTDPDFLEKYQVRYSEFTVIDQFSKIAIAVSIGHLLMIKHWYETTNEYIGFFIEDDVNLELCNHWPFKWSDIIAKWPEGCNFMQLCLIRNDDIPDWQFGLNYRYEGNWGLTAYALTRDHARMIVKEVFATPEEYNLILPGQEWVRPWAEYMIIRYNDPARTWPVFAEREMVDSESLHYHSSQHRCSKRVHDYYRNIK
jgi:hypothetical protein